MSFTSLASLPMMLIYDQLAATPSNYSLFNTVESKYFTEFPLFNHSMIY